MFVIKWLKDIGLLALSLFGALLGWLFLAPIATVIPKRMDWVAVIGRQHGRFLDNAKYFFLGTSLEHLDIDVRFISEWTSVTKAISAHGLSALRYPRPKSIWFLLRCGCAVVDSTDWNDHFRRFLLIRTPVVQLWHGVGFKRIERDRWRHEVGRAQWASTPWFFALRMMLYRFSGRVVRYAAVCSTSMFYRDKVFSQAFLSHHFPITGYPRNGFARDYHGETLSLAWDNVDAQVRDRLAEWSATGKRLILIVPTMRDSHKAPMQLDAAAMQKLDTFAKAHGIEFLFKFHPSDRNVLSIKGTHLHVCAPHSDVYPLLPHCDALVTDYSSIYMDFLVLDRPVLFLITDGDSYSREDRETQFDPSSMMPGPQLSTWDELLEVLAAPPSSDTYAPERARLRAMAFDHMSQTESTARLLDFMRSQGWLPNAPSPPTH